MKKYLTINLEYKVEVKKITNEGAKGTDKIFIVTKNMHI